MRTEVAPVTGIQVRLIADGNVFAGLGSGLLRLGAWTVALYVGGMLGTLGGRIALGWM